MSLAETFTPRIQQEPSTFNLETTQSLPPRAAAARATFPTAAAHHPTAATSQGQSSRHRGVSLLRRTGRWHAQINFDGRQIHLGFFAQEHEAAAAYDRALLIKWAAASGGSDALLLSRMQQTVAPSSALPQTNLALSTYAHELPAITEITPARLLAALGDERLRKNVMDALAHGFTAPLMNGGSQATIPHHMSVHNNTHNNTTMSITTTTTTVSTTDGIQSIRHLATSLAPVKSADDGETNQDTDDDDNDNNNNDNAMDVDEETHNNTNHHCIGTRSAMKQQQCVVLEGMQAEYRDLQHYRNQAPPSKVAIGNGNGGGKAVAMAPMTPKIFIVGRSAHRRKPVVPVRGSME